MKKEVNVKRYKAKVGDILIDENLKAYFIVTDDESEFKELIQREDFQLLIRKAEM